jgi:hypothetical protein
MDDSHARTLRHASGAIGSARDDVIVTSGTGGSGAADIGFAERLLEVIDSGRRTATYKLSLLMALLDLCARRSDANGRAPELLYTRDIAEQVAALHWPQVIPYRLPDTDGAIELRQINLPRAAILGAVSTLRQRAEAVGVTSLHSARQRLPREYESMLDQVEITVAAQPLPRLQAVGSAETVFPFIYELGGVRASRSPRHGCAAMGAGVPQSDCFLAPAMSLSGLARSSALWSSCTGRGWLLRSTGWPRPSWASAVTCSDRTG